VTKIEMGVDWDAVREEIAGKRVPSITAGLFWWGNNSGAKRSLDRNYLKYAEATGNVEIRPLHQVTQIALGSDGGYDVSYDVIDEQGGVLRRETLICTYLFLGAGPFGTCKLLMRAKSRGSLPRLSDALGQSFGNDGDIFLVRHPVPVKANPHAGGPGCYAIVDYRNPVMPSVMMPLSLPRFAEAFPEGNAIASFVFSHTRHRGTLGYDPAADALELGFSLDTEAAARSIVDRLNAANGGELHSINARITGHPLGGASMGTLCDANGRVNGYQSLYVVDGALIPGASAAVNPAFLISAIAERCMEHILAEDMRR
jgi:cholesterol oxidase